MLKNAKKTKAELQADMDRLNKINHEKWLVKLMWPFIENQKTIYDAQTAFNALSGFIKFGMDKKISELKVSDVGVDLTKEKDSEIKTSIVNLLGLVENESAKDAANLLERVGNALAQFGAHQFLKNPISSIKIEDIVAK